MFLRPDDDGLVRLLVLFLGLEVVLLHSVAADGNARTRFMKAVMVRADGNAATAILIYSASVCTK